MKNWCGVIFILIRSSFISKLSKVQISSIFNNMWIYLVPKFVLQIKDFAKNERKYIFAKAYYLMHHSIEILCSSDSILK